MSDFAPGLPDRKVMHDFPKIEKPKVFEFALHDHASEGAAKQHFDLRLGDPDTGHAHSWAMKYWPKPGEVRLAIMQPTHTVPYMDWEGRIEGYGKGEVKLARRDKTEIVSSSKGHVRFNIYSGKQNEEYLLRRTEDNQWLLKNITSTREKTDLPSSKPAYKSIHPDKLALEDPNTILQAKIDGAHVLYHFKATGRTPDIFSYRPTERATGIIEHTHRVPGVLEQRTPSAIKDTILRGELYATDPRGRALESHRVGGMLNANVWKSREKQRTEGELVPIVFDVVKWKGKDVTDAPYSEKMKMLEQAVTSAPWLKLPRTAKTPEEKKKLLEEIRSGKEPSTKEGVIEWHLDKALPRKSKFRDEHDVFIREVFPEESKRGLAGGFAYSMTKSGPIVGKVGTGFSHSLKKDLVKNSDRYIGLRAKVQMAPGHLGRAPSFAGFHLDQELPTEIKLAGRLEKEEKRPFFQDYLRHTALNLGGALRNVRHITDLPDADKYPLPKKTEVEKQAAAKLAERAKKKVVFQGFKISLDRPKGFVQEGKDASGKPWSRVYKNDYGFLPKTEGGDGEALDVFLGPNEGAKEAYWVTQTKDGKFDEFKVFLGFNSAKEAKSAYLAHIPSKFFHHMDTMPVAMMKALLGNPPNVHS